MREPILNNPSDFHLKDGSVIVEKEIFKQIQRLVSNRLEGRGPLSMLDVGCASGDLIYYLSQKLPGGSYCGVDLGSELIDNAKQRFPDSGIDFICADAESFDLQKRFDVVTAISVISYFEYPHKVVENLLRHLKPGGMALISGLFNQNDVYVWMKYQKVGSSEKHGGFNQFPVSEIKKIILDNGFRCNIHEQVMPFDLEKNFDHPGRSYSVNMDGVRYNRNDLQLVWNIQIFEIY